MNLYNTKTRQISTFTPLNPPHVTIYTCGPTVYDYAHIGHWFTYIRNDLLIRALQANGYKTDWVINITDVGHLVSDADEGEDKLEKGAKREGKSAWEIAEFYTKDFLEGMETLNILQPNHLPRATEHIKEQIELIESLETKGYTYQISDGVYFDTSKFADYAKFVRLDVDENQAQTRVGINPEKRQQNDFALWKFSPADTKRDMEWDSPWGKGFPGWHVECSAMSMKYLGATLDIHTGGIDHVPVHHTNEIAQSESVTGQEFARWWFHTNHVLIDGHKISKSQQNGIRLSDISAHGISPEAFRLHVLESHYRSQSKFSWDSLTAAANRLADFKAMADLRWQPQSATLTDFDFEAAAQHLVKLISDDLNTPAMMAYLSQLSAQLQTRLIAADEVADFVKLLNTVDGLLGLKLSETNDLTPDQKDLISKRSRARADNYWDQADSIRDNLLDQGVAIRDVAESAIWYRA